MTQKELDRMVKTARSNGAIGHKAVLPRFISEIPALKPHLILDFGCGKEAIHVKMLRDQGFEFIFGKDLVPLNNPEYEFQHVDSVPWHLVYASNVLNIQPSLAVLEVTLSQVSHYARHGVVYFSYPSSPRHMKLSVSDMQDAISPFFQSVWRFRFCNTVLYKAVGKFCQKGLARRLTVDA